MAQGSKGRRARPDRLARWVTWWKRATAGSALALGLVLLLVALDVWRSAAALGVTLGLTLALLLVAAARGLWLGGRTMAREPRHLGACLASAACIVFAFPPFDLSPLIFAAWVPLLWVIQRVTPWQAFFWGWFVGFVITAVGFYFILDVIQVFGGLSFLPALAGHLLFAAFQGVGIGIFAGLARWLSGGGRGSVLLIAPVCYVVAEMVVREIYVFPWYLGSAAHNLIWFLQIADVLGGFGLTALAVLINAVIYEAAVGRRAGERLRWRPIALAGGLLAATLVYGVVRVGQVEAVMREQPSLKVGIVEADVGIMRKAKNQHIDYNRLLHQRLSAELAERGAELIVWPESSLPPGSYVVTEKKTQDLAELRASATVRAGRLRPSTTWVRPSKVPAPATLAGDANTPEEERYSLQRGFTTPLVFGALTEREPTATELPTIPPRRGVRKYSYNTMFAVDEHGRVLGSYDKKVLLHFGEHFPLAHELYATLGVNPFRWLPSVLDVTAGHDAEVIEVPLPRDGGKTRVRLGAMICYEDIFARHALELVEQHPNIFVNIINDAWFGESSAAYHHMAFSVLRSVEHRLGLVRSTNTGVSSIIDPVGRVIAETKLTGIETLLEDVPIMPAQATIYGRIGDVVGWAALFALLTLGVQNIRRRRSNAAAPMQ